MSQYGECAGKEFKPGKEQEGVYKGYTVRVCHVEHGVGMEKIQKQNMTTN